ncbi:MAG: hypothetical protein ACOX4U_07430 [Anaerovoracaceae bacterium]|jgi:hypothetical protein
MKQLIVLISVLPILLIFLAQYTLDQKNSAMVSQFQEEVYAAKEQARQEGYFSDEIRHSLKERLHSKLGIDYEDIEIEATDSRQYRVNHFDSVTGRGIIHYKISIPIERLMAGGKLMGLEAKENRGRYTIEGTAASERLPD